MSQLVSDEELVKLLPGFSNHYVEVNGITLHYVESGKGEPLVLLPGWPQTWWAYHKLMPALSEKYHVIAVDIRGMGSSSTPEGGYDKKNMAKDLSDLIKVIGYSKITVAGHDIGAAVAFSFAANHPEQTAKLIMLDTPHPDQNMYKLPMLPVGMPVYPWWVAFNQVKELPEALLEGRYAILQEWVFNSLLIDRDAINDFDRLVYAHHYNKKDNIRASNGWYQSFVQDIEDVKMYDKINIPVAAIGSKTGCQMLGYFLSPFSDSVTITEIENSSHFVMEENPLQVIQAIKVFLA
ncbi:alpha/beta hydrolase [Flavobacterium sp. DG1-102-2]|uniref:alpha/beta hydrolase n=1 Tax=Flavobacterium sp. DG1-102-2 TaxID=3081663 RepID=UPI00294970B4|nr:alpha/beta hydrolase [Flavobacterium sp. DG1-102-2]MDV6169909.1 alpha/beta hydrolase [Flavobacterium sp. DG1-102-2]